MKQPIPGGVVHELADDLHQAIVTDTAAKKAWLGITPLARNEWICWVENAKLIETRQRRIGRR